MGLVSASILPTVSLAINGMNGTGRSVLKINELYKDLRESTERLFRTLGWVTFVAISLVIYSIIPVVDWSIQFWFIEWNADNILKRLLQAIIFTSTAIALGEAYLVPKIFHKVLNVKRDIAIYHARQEIRENVPTEAYVKQNFATKDDFGKTVNISQIENEK